MEFLRPGKIHQEQPLEQEEMERSQATYDIDVALDADMSRIRMLRMRQPELLAREISLLLDSDGVGLVTMSDVKRCREGQDAEKLKALMDLAAQVGYGFFGCLPKEDNYIGILSGS